MVVPARPGVRARRKTNGRVCLQLLRTTSGGNTAMVIGFARRRPCRWRHIPMCALPIPPVPIARFQLPPSPTLRALRFSGACLCGGGCNTAYKTMAGEDSNGAVGSNHMAAAWLAFLRGAFYQFDSVFLNLLRRRGWRARASISSPFLLLFCKLPDIVWYFSCCSDAALLPVLRAATPSANNGGGMA